MKLLHLAYLPLLLFLVNCAQLTVETPLPLADNPETVGYTGRIGLVTEVLPSESIEVTSNAGARPPKFDTPNVTTTGFPEFRVEGGLGSFFELAIGLGINGFLVNGGSTTNGRAKIQLLGDPKSSAKAHNFSLAAFGHLGVTSSGNSGSQEETFGGGGSEWKGNIKASYRIYGASLGYRPSDRTILFIGYGKGTYDVNGSINQDAAGADLGGSYPFTQKGTADAITLGFNWNSASSFFVFGFKVAHYNFDWENLDTDTGTVWTGNFGFYLF